MLDPLWRKTVVGREMQGIPSACLERFVANQLSFVKFIADVSLICKTVCYTARLRDLNLQFTCTITHVSICLLQAF